MSLKDLKEVWEIERLSYSTPWSISQFYSEYQNHLSQPYTAKTESTGNYPGLIEEKVSLVGYVIFRLIVSEAHFLNIAVHSLYRCQGIGSRLLEFALESCKMKGVSDAFLEVRRSNIPAQRLYKKFGFKKVGVRKCYYPDNKEDAILLTLTM